jgi:N utilization substance protein B
MTIAPLRKPAVTKGARSASRLAAVQALYQMDVAGTPLNAVIAEFGELRFGIELPAHDPSMVANVPEPGEMAVSGADPTFFSEILKGVVRRQRDFDPLIDQSLAEGWRLVRVDSILRAILRAGLFELMERSDVPARVVINEYIDVAHAFFDDEEPKVVNGVLDRLAKRFRLAEFEARERAQAPVKEAPSDTPKDRTKA